MAALPGFGGRRLRKRINSKEVRGENIFNTLIDHRIKTAEEIREKAGKNIKVLNRVATELEGYTCIVELVQTVQIWGYTTSNTGSGTTYREV